MARVAATSPIRARAPPPTPALTPMRVCVCAGIDIRDASSAKQALGLSVARREFGSVLAGIQAQIRAGNTFGLDPSELG